LVDVGRIDPQQRRIARRADEQSEIGGGLVQIEVRRIGAVAEAKRAAALGRLLRPAGARKNGGCRDRTGARLEQCATTDGSHITIATRLHLRAPRSLKALGQPSGKSSSWGLRDDARDATAWRDSKPRRKYAVISSAICRGSNGPPGWYHLGIQ